MFFDQNNTLYGVLRIISTASSFPLCLADGDLMMHQGIIQKSPGDGDLMMVT